MASRASAAQRRSSSEIVDAGTAQREFVDHTTSAVEIGAGRGPMLTKPVELADAVADAGTS